MSAPKFRVVCANGHTIAEGTAEECERWMRRACPYEGCDTADLSHAERVEEGCEHRLIQKPAPIVPQSEVELATLKARVAELESLLRKVTDGMDRAGGDGYGMPECPWCGADGEREGDENWHEPNCDLLSIRSALTPPQPSLPYALPEEER